MHYDQLKTITAILSKSKENSDISDTNCDYLSSFFSIIRNIFSVDPNIPGTWLFSTRGTQIKSIQLIEEMQYASHKKLYKHHFQYHTLYQ